jgi:ABC-type oligopeptide transport system substrate-binding subunit/class 3 adenylate cyclase
MNCPNCSFDNLADAKFCQNCGQPLERPCPECGTLNAGSARFCRNCGFNFLGKSSPAATSSLSALRQTAPAALQEKIRAARASIEGERKPVTILFSDIVGSTSLAEKLDPEEWKEIVSAAHWHVSVAVYRYEGTIAQLLGDGVLAFFGAPVIHEDDPVRAVRAALDIQHSIGKYARSLEGYVDDFRMRIGVNTGTVVVGNIGSDLHMEYLAIGDSVNLAARLQSTAQPGRVLLSENTARLVKATFELKSLGGITVKGKTEPVQVFEVLETKAVPQRGRGIEGLTSPLVGREDELQRLYESLDALREGHGQVVVAMGEAGIGKSRLVEEAKGTTQGVRWLEGRSLSYGQTLSFWAITQLLKADLGLSDGDPEAKICVALRRRMSLLFGERASDLMPYLSHLLGLKLESEAAEQVRVLDGETLKRQIMLAIGDYSARLAQEAPTVLVFEDLHWADPSTLEALEHHLLPLTDRVPLMLLLLSRVEREHGSWRIKLKAETDYAHRYIEINLKPLSADDSNRLVNNLLEVADLPQAIRRLILERSEGNPFYLEEIIRSLIEQGAIVHEAQTWRATSQIANVAIPDTLQGVLLARIDRLEENVRRTLQLASVIGKSFLYRLLEVIAEAERQLDAHLLQLQRADLVREKTRRPELEYIFKHSLTQEAAYNSLLVERRKEFHRRVGEALEKLFVDRKEEFYGLLAHHFDAAGKIDKAVDYLVKAGDKSRLEDAHEEAIGYYKRAVMLSAEMADEAQAARTWLKLGLIYHANFDFEAAHKAYDTAFALQRKTRPIPAEPRRTAAGKPLNLFRFGTMRDVGTLDPGREEWSHEGDLVLNIFAGLAEIDAELNLVPHVARSWEVLDGGTRYLAHLRDDVRWTDGNPVTAHDFEWAWKRNLAPATRAPLASFLDDIVGARDYREGRSDDPDSVGVQSLDDHNLEVRLLTPVAYFPYLFGLPITFPLPRAAIERYGDEWWKPEHSVSNGAFRLVQVDGEHWVFERNRDYFGEFPGNLDRMECMYTRDPVERLRQYLEDKADQCSISRVEAPENLVQMAEADIQPNRPVLMTNYLLFSLDQPPADDLRVRRALVQAIDWQRTREAWHLPGKAQVLGGMVPPGMPGHSPGIAFRFDLETARRLMAEAGYPGGRGCPPLILGYKAALTPYLPELVRQWHEHLGVEVRIEYDPLGTSSIRSHILVHGWLADYPDPDIFLRNSDVYATLRRGGWSDQRYQVLVEQAAHTPDRAQRMAMYREADRIWVSEQTVVCPVGYDDGSRFITLVKPWVKNLRQSTLQMVQYKTINIEPH